MGVYAPVGFGWVARVVPELLHRTCEKCVKLGGCVRERCASIVHGSPPNPRRQHRRDRVNKRLSGAHAAVADGGLLKRRRAWSAGAPTPWAGSQSGGGSFPPCLVDFTQNQRVSGRNLSDN